MCSELTPKEKAKYGMVYDIREEYGGSRGAKRKIVSAIGRKVRYECCVYL